MYRFSAILLMLMCLFSVPGCAPRFIGQGPLPEPGSHFFSLTSGGERREFLLHLPPEAAPVRPFPLVVVLHGYAAGARGIERVSGMSGKADHEGFIVAYPQGTGLIRTAWNAGFCCGDAFLRDVDDRRFIGDLIAALKGRLKIDPDRIYVAGFSNGGMMAYSLAATMPDVFAAAAVVSATAGIRSSDKRHALAIPEPSAPVPVVVFHGMEDRHLPYQGGAGAGTKGAFEYLSVAESLAFWVRTNGCNTTPLKETQTGGAVLIDTYACLRRADVILYSIKSGGHEWPTGGDCAGRGESVSATDVIWEFFRSHPKRNNVAGQMP